MKNEHLRFVDAEIHSGQRIAFPDGLLGFPDIKEYQLFDIAPDIPFKTLQATNETDLAFVLMDPFTVFTDYHITLDKQDVKELCEQEAGNLMVLVILTIPPGSPQKATANLQGPLVINVSNYLGKQLVLSQSPYHTRHPLHPLPTLQRHKSNELSTQDFSMSVDKETV